MNDRPIIIATRGSALALAQANTVLDNCRTTFPNLRFELRIIKTTGDKMQTASMARIDANLPRGLFTKELEVALLEKSADLAVHSLKDLPTELPDGLILGAVLKREDVRDVFVYRDSRGTKVGRGFKPKLAIKDFPESITVATSSTRRKAQILALRPDFKVVEIRGNVATRLHKLAENPELDATILAAAGLRRLHFEITSEGVLQGSEVPEGLLATVVDVDQMLPCVGQAAIGIETRENDPEITAICERLNDSETLQAVVAERSLLRAMGGGCQSPVGAYAELSGDQLRLRAISFLNDSVRHAEGQRLAEEAIELGQELAHRLKTK